MPQGYSFVTNSSKWFSGWLFYMNLVIIINRLFEVLEMFQNPCVQTECYTYDYQLWTPKIDIAGDNNCKPAFDCRLIRVCSMSVNHVGPGTAKKSKMALHPLSSVCQTRKKYLSSTTLQTNHCLQKLLVLTVFLIQSPHNWICIVMWYALFWKKFFWDTIAQCLRKY